LGSSEAVWSDEGWMQEFGAEGQAAKNANVEGAETLKEKGPTAGSEEV
jgi:hypothetical protein